MSGERATADNLTDDQISKERQLLDRDITKLQLKHGSKAEPLTRPLHALRHDCWVAVGLHRSPVIGGKLDVRRRIAAAINARRGGGGR